MFCRSSIGIPTAMLAIMLAGACQPSDSPDTKSTAEPTRADVLLEEGRKALSAGDFNTATEAFADLSLFAAYRCQAEYGALLARGLKALDTVDPLVQAAGILQGAETVGQALPVLRDYAPILLDVLLPLEEVIAQLRVHARNVIADRCTFDLPSGYPVELGRDSSELYLLAVLGDQWDAATARLVLAGVNGLQAGIDYLLAHRYAVGEQITEALQIIEDAPDEVTGDLGPTWVHQARALGVLFDWNPLLLQFSLDRNDRNRIFRIDDQLEEAFRAVYHQREGGSSAGIVGELMRRNGEDPNLEDNVLAVLDNGDGNLSVGDSILFGVHELTFNSIVAPSNEDPGLETPPTSLYQIKLEGGIRLLLQPGLGSVDEAVRQFHAIVQNLGNQMRAVDDPEVAWQRLGLKEINQIIFNLEPLAARFPKLPEAVEFDFRAFWLSPVPARWLLPYWYDPDGDPQTPDEFMVEAESAVGGDRWIFEYDRGHFPGIFRFDTLTGVDAVLVDDVQIGPDKVFPNEKIRIPTPYIAWRDPTFHNVIYIDTTRFPVRAEGTVGFEPATQYDLNKLVNGYLVWYTEETGETVE